MNCPANISMSSLFAQIDALSREERHDLGSNSKGWFTQNMRRAAHMYRAAHHRPALSRMTVNCNRRTTSTNALTSPSALSQVSLASQNPLKQPTRPCSWADRSSHKQRLMGTIHSSRAEQNHAYSSFPFEPLPRPLLNYERDHIYLVLIDLSRPRQVISMFGQGEWVLLARAHSLILSRLDDRPKGILIRSEARIDEGTRNGGTRRDQIRDSRFDPLY